MKSREFILSTVFGSVISFGAQAATTPISGNSDLYGLLSTADYVGGLVVSVTATHLTMSQ